MKGLIAHFIVMSYILNQVIFVIYVFSFHVLTITDNVMSFE